MVRDTLNIDVPVSRRQVSLEVGDVAAVFQIGGTRRWPCRGNRILPTASGSLKGARECRMGTINGEIG
jgi:hypothetical protein